MQRVPSDEAKNLPVPVWDTYQSILNAAEGREVSQCAATSRQSGQ